MRVEHNLEVMAIAHSQLLAEEGDLAVIAVPDEDRALRRPDNYLRALTLVHEALRNVVMDVELAVFIIVYSEVTPSELPRYSGKEFTLLVGEEELAVGCTLRRPVFSVPGVLFGSRCCLELHLGVLLGRRHLLVCIHRVLVFSRLFLLETGA